MGNLKAMAVMLIVVLAGRPFGAAAWMPIPPSFSDTGLFPTTPNVGLRLDYFGRIPTWLSPLFESFAAPLFSTKSLRRLSQVSGFYPEHRSVATFPGTYGVARCNIHVDGSELTH